MRITRKEITFIPQTLEGKKLADEYQKRLQEQSAFVDRKEDTQFISITARYIFEMRGEKDDARY